MVHEERREILSVREVPASEGNIMKNQENLMLTMSDVTGTLFERQIASYIEKQAEAFRVGRQLITINRDLMKPGSGNEILIPMRNALDATVVAEGVSISLATPSYDSVAIKVQILGSGVEIGDETLEAAQFNLINDQLENLALAIAQKEDLDIIYELCDYTEVGTVESFTGTGTEVTYALANSGVLHVNEIILDTVTAVIADGDYTCNYKDGRVLLSAAMSTDGVMTVDYAYAASITVVAVATAGILGYDAIIRARNQVLSNKYKPNILIIHPNQEADLLQEQKFYDASEFGDSNPIKNGLIGRIAGLDVYVTQNCPEGCGIVCDARKAVTYAVKRDIYTKMTKEGSYAVKGTVAIMAKLWSKAGLVNTGATVAIVGAADDATLS